MQSDLDDEAFGIKYVQDKENKMLIEKNKQEIQKLKLEINAHKEFQKDLNSIKFKSNTKRLASLTNIDDAQLRNELIRIES